MRIQDDHVEEDSGGAWPPGENDFWNPSLLAAKHWKLGYDPILNDAMKDDTTITGGKGASQEPAKD